MPALPGEASEPGEQIAVNRYFQKGIEYSNKGEHEKAAEEFRKAITIDERFPDAYLALTVALINMREPEEALVYAVRASELDPESRKALFIKARLYERNGETDKAISAWERYLKLNPEGRRARKAKRHLETLREAQ